MSPNNDFSALASAYQEANNFVIFLHPQVTYDAVAAALAMRLAFKQAGKSVEVVCEEPMRVEYNHLIAIDEVDQEVGNRDLVVSFAYEEDQVETVSYNVDELNKRFELIITPKAGKSALDPSTLDFRHAGLRADVVFMFGYHALNELGEMYDRERSAIDGAFTVAVTQSKVPSFAKLHLQLQPDQLSYSELVYFLIRQLQAAEIKDDIATNLLAGIEYATDRFLQPGMNARTFDTVAELMRQGANRSANNPAFENLQTPIRQTHEAMPQGEMIEDGEVVQDESVLKKMKSAAQQVSPSDFAKAMGQRNL